jgi:hypothetical protein
MLSKRTLYLSGNPALWVTSMRHPKEEFQKGEWQLNIPLTLKTLMLDHPTLNSINIWILLQAYIVISHPDSTTVRRMIRAPSPLIPTPTCCFCIGRSEEYTCQRCRTDKGCGSERTPASYFTFFAYDKARNFTVHLRV